MDLFLIFYYKDLKMFPLQIFPLHKIFLGGSYKYGHILIVMDLP